MIAIILSLHVSFTPPHAAVSPYAVQPLRLTRQRTHVHRLGGGWADLRAPRRWLPVLLAASESPDDVVGGTAAPTTGTAGLLARAMGWVLTAAAVTLYVPMVVSTLRSRDATGMSAATWSMQLTGFLIFVTYHRRNALPLSTYTDIAALAVQSLILLVLICLFQGHLHAVAALPIVGMVAAVTLPKPGLQNLQAASTVVTSAALLPQILDNFASHSRGGWSPVSAALSTIGNAMRVFTTLKLAGGNPLLLAQFGVNTLTNGILLAQSLVWL